MKARPAIEKRPYIKNTPEGVILLESDIGITKSWRSTSMSSVIITAPRAMSEQTSTAYRGARGPRVSWKRNATKHTRIKTALKLLFSREIATPMSENAIPA